MDQTQECNALEFLNHFLTGFGENSINNKLTVIKNVLKMNDREIENLLSILKNKEKESA